MPWKTSRPHGDSSSQPVGRHVDVYHTNSAGKRDQSHSSDFKVSHNEKAPVVRDIAPPKK